MDGLVELSWRVYPSASLMAAGAGLMLWGVRAQLSGMRRSRDERPTKLITVVGGLRLVFIGFAIAGSAAAWNWHLLWLLVLALAIGGEETLESSMVLYGLRMGERLKTRTARSAGLRGIQA